jgi:hypothetical protein
MMWEYKTITTKVAEEELGEKLNSYGMVGWEVYNISDKGKVNEFSSQGNTLHKFVIQLKRIL